MSREISENERLYLRKDRRTGAALYRERSAERSGSISGKSGEREQLYLGEGAAKRSSSISREISGEEQFYLRKDRREGATLSLERSAYGSSSISGEGAAKRNSSVSREISGKERLYLRKDR